MKKAIKIMLITVLSLFLVLLIVPFIFKDKIVEVVKTEINKQLDANVDFGEFHLSLIRNFPHLSVGIDDVSVSGIGDFEGDTLAAIQKTQVVVNISFLWKDSGYELNKIELVKPSIYGHILESGKANWDILKSGEETEEEDVEEAEEDDTVSDFNLTIGKIKIQNASVAYRDDSLKMEAAIEDFNLSFSGDIAQNSNGNLIAGVKELILSAEDLYYIDDVAEMSASIKMPKLEIKADAVQGENTSLMANIKELAFSVDTLSYADASLSASVEKTRLNIKADASQGENAGFLTNISQLDLAVGKIVYVDNAGNMSAYINNTQFDLKGSLSQEKMNIKTNAGIQSITLIMDKIPYLKDADFEANINLIAELEKNKFTLAENKIRLNKIVANIDGWVALLDEGYDMDLKLNTPQINFKDILSLIPSIFTKDFESIKTAGKVSLSAYLQGVYNDDRFPAFDVALHVADAMFQYPDLPKAVTNINIDAQAKNTTDKLDSMKITVSNFHFDIENNPFDIRLNLTKPMSNPTFDASVLGVLNLGIVKDIYPFEEGMSLNGIFTADLKAKGSLAEIESGRYEDLNVQGNLQINDFLFKTPAIKDQIEIANTGLLFSTRYAELNALVKIGRNDISAKGRLENFLAFALRDETLLGRLTLNSNYLNLNDFMTSEEQKDVPAEKPAAETAAQPAETASLSVIQVPANLDLALKANFKKLIYDKINMETVNGDITMKNSRLNLNNLSTKAMGGSMGIHGFYDTKDTLKPKVALDLDIKQVSFKEAFNQLGLIQDLAPMFQKMDGDFQMYLKMNTDLDRNMMPVYSTLNGTGNLKAKEITLSNFDILDQLTKAISYVGVNRKLTDVSVTFDIKNGRLYTKPFDVKMGSKVSMNVFGSTGLDQTIDYTARITVPNEKVPAIPLVFDALIKGTFDKPKVSVSLKETLNAVVDVAKEVVKEKVVEVSTKLIDEAKAQKARLVSEAQKQADKLKKEAQAASDKLIADAQKKAQAEIDKVKNPLAKKAVQLTADKMVEEARNQAKNNLTKINSEADKLVKEAEAAGNKLIREAEEKTNKMK